jgi:ureidoacrylate peracid hydrolase
MLHPDGSIAQLGLPIQRMQRALPHLKTLAAAARAAGLPVIFLQMWIEDYNSGILVEHFPPLRDLRHCAAGSWDAQFIDELQPLEQETVVRHYRLSGFHESGLEQALSSLAVRSIVLAGFATNTVVESTARSAFDHDMHTYIPRETTASYTPEMAEASFLNLSVGIARVVQLDSVLRSLTETAKTTSREL